MSSHFDQYSSHSYYQPATTENIIKNYLLLSSQNQQDRQHANHFLLTLSDHQQTWVTSQKMIKTNEDTNFVYLGAQLLYQKIQKDLHHLDNHYKIDLKNFIFEQLDSNKHQNKFFIIDKLASSLALIICSLVLTEWKQFLQNLTQFMKKSTHHLICGLIILQRIPDELKMTNRISQGIKTQIQNYFLQKQQHFAIIFNSVFQLQDKNSTQRSMRTMQSWIKVGFNLMTYQHLVKKVLQISLQSYQNLQTGIKVICQALKLTSQKHLTSLSGQRDPLKQQSQYSQNQINSLKIIITFVLQNKGNFFSYSKIQVQYLQLYLEAVKQLLLNYSFLICENIGFQLLQIIYTITQMKDLKVSQSTFQFWIDYSDKITKLLISEQIKQKIKTIYIKLFELFSGKKLIIQNQTVMFEADLKDDQTVDENNGMTFSQYRKQVSSLLKYIYDYLVRTKGQTGSQIYFKKICTLLQTDNPPLTKQTQLAIFLLKSPLQSMINKNQTLYIIQILQYLLTKINQHNVILSHIPPIVLGQTMNFIRDCTRQIKQKDSLFLQSLKFVLNYINDQKLCHHAAYCFQILMENINTLNDPHIAESLIEFYQHKKFTKQIVLERMLEGIFNAIIKVKQQQKVDQYLNIILITLIKKYQQCSKTFTNVTNDSQSSSQLFLCLVEIKTVLNSFDSIGEQFKNIYKYKFIQLSNKSLQIVNQILPLGIKNKLRFSSINQIGLCISIYRVCLKILQIPQNFNRIRFNQYNNTPNFIPILQTIFLILNQKDISEYYYSLTLLSQTLIQFINHQSNELNQWLINKLSILDYFLATYYQIDESGMINNQIIQKVDPDIIKTFFTVYEALILYNREIMKHNKNKELILNISLYSLKQLNQRNMQRKIISFLSLSLQNQIYLSSGSSEQILTNTFMSIPNINSICYSNLSKIYKYLFKKTTLQDKQKIFYSLLNQPPFANLNIDNTIIILLSKTISFALQMGEERHIKFIFAQMNEIVWKKVNNDILMQLELRLATWKRQYKKILKEQNINTNTANN